MIPFKADISHLVMLMSLTFLVSYPVRHEAVPMKNRLKVLRAERNWTQAQLADALDVSRQTVNAIETGKFDPSLPLAFRAARLFGLRIEEIFHVEAERNRVFETWIEAHKAILFKVARAYGATHSDREDLFQEIALQVWHSVEAYRGDCAGNHLDLPGRR